jgi:two-component system chemotaxis response regulator CheY
MLALVVDDSRSMRMILRRVLSGLGCEVIEADNGRVALEVLSAAETLPDVAMVDWNMPEVNGLELVTAVRARPDWRGISLIMVTTESEQYQITRALAAGANEYVIKPFTAQTVVDKFALLGMIQPVA